MKTITIPATRYNVLANLFEEPPPCLLQVDQVQGFLLSVKQYETLLKMLEDIEDYHDALLAEAEYQAGQGRSFAEYDTKRKEKSDV